MSHPIIETATYPTSITAPDDGDDETAVATPAPLETPLQQLADRTKYTSTFLAYLKINGIVLAGTSTVLSWNAFGAWFWDGTNGVHTAVAPNTATPGVLTASTFYYVYFYLAAGVPTMEVSTTVPDATLTTKNTDPLRLYAGWFLTDGAGAIVPFRMTRGRHMFRGPSALKPLNAGTSTAGASVNLAPYMPPHARVAVLITELFADAGATRTGTLWVTGVTADTMVWLAAASTANTLEQERETDASRTISYSVSNAAASMSIYVAGVVE
jgi:hypothetical protein